MSGLETVHLSCPDAHELEMAPWSGGSIVTHDVEPYSIVVGNPARVLRMRFDKDTCDALEKSRWWELEPNELMDFYDLMHDPVAFAQAIMDGRRND